jgi:hypothetical protein
MNNRELLDWTTQVYNLFNDADKKESLILFFSRETKKDSALKLKVQKAILELRDMKFAPEIDIKDLMVINSMEALLLEILGEK